ncbi:hypothetical protein F5Y06DRAFT_58077 [Hypoxylon sp. FL0890]|nr:hypothetical protein F5Y06DRAFT_58077 [Hypoxylon sp. FL0890]
MDPDADESGPTPASQTSSHFPLLEPVSGATLFELESARREKVKQRGRLRTGCDEIDDKALLGGFERGEVVGVSAEEGEFGLLVGLQTVAHAMVFGTKQRAAIITTLPATAILPTLRDVIKAQVQAKLGPAANHRQQEVNAEVRRCLEQISVSRVFDVEGLWEVLCELETPLSPAPSASPAVEPGEEGRKKDGILMGKEEDPPEKLDTSRCSPEEPIEERDGAAANSPILPSLREPLKIERTEVGDSEEDEDEELSLLSSQSPPRDQPIPSPRPQPSPSPSPPTLAPAAPVAPAPTTVLESTSEQDGVSHIPDIILITHFSSLLTNLFTRSADNKTSAHTTLQLLSSHLRYLARSSSGPLVMLLNTTTSTSSFSTSATGTSTTPNTVNVNPTTPATVSKNRPLEPTLRSIFNPAPLPGAGGAVGVGVGGGGGAGGGNRRQNKPAFGATFAQFLDLHLLCTRVPRTRPDAEALFAPAGVMGMSEVRYCWVLEVLLDELGVWEWDDDDGAVQGTVGSKGQGKDCTAEKNRRWTRRSREQRWGAVGVRGGVRLVDAFQGGLQETRDKGPMKIAAGFGGPPARAL